MVAMTATFPGMPRQYKQAWTTWMAGLWRAALMAAMQGMGAHGDVTGPVPGLSYRPYPGSGGQRQAPSGPAANQFVLERPGSAPPQDRHLAQTLSELSSIMTQMRPPVPWQACG